MAYAATFDIPRPTEEFDRAQIVLRLLIALVISWLASWLVGAAYWLLPIIAAIMVSQKGPEQYLAEAQTGPVRWIRYIMGFYSYVSLATDKLPFDDPDSVNFHVRTTGSPTVGSALLRIITAIPHWFVLGILGFIFFFIWIFMAISVLVSGKYPDWAFDYISGYLRWVARVLAYVASLVDEYPPFSFSDEGVSSVAQTAPPSSPPPAASSAPPAAPAQNPPPSEPPQAGGGDRPQS
jgi:hypothetical protein